MRYTILFVEDDEVDRMAFERFVRTEALPYDYTLASSMREARDLLVNRTFDAALIDYHLGQETALQLFAANIRTPIIVVTGSSEIDIAVEVMKAGASDFISKDPAGSYLQAIPFKIANTVEQWKAKQELKSYRTRLEELVEERTAAWKAEQARLKTVVETAPLIVFSLDEKGVFNFVVGNTQGMLGLAPDAMIGQSLLSLFPDSEIQDVFDGETFSADVCVEDRWFSLHLVKRRQHDGIFGVLQDITERRQAAQERHKAERLRAEIERERELLAMKQRFIATTSHDFRTPLTIIKTDAHILEKFMDTLSPERRLAKLRQIQNQVTHMTALLDDVLTISHLNTGRVSLSPVLLDIKPFCDRIWDDMLLLDEGKHLTKYHYQVSLQHISADKKLLHHALVNLLSNAFKYTPPGGEVSFEVTNTAQYITFKIADTGYGIPKDDLAQLFEPFHRASNVSDIEGTGLGLVIAQEYVNLHDGSVEVESIEGRGSTFSVRLPLKPSKFGR